MNNLECKKKVFACFFWPQTNDKFWLATVKIMKNVSFSFASNDYLKIDDTPITSFCRISLNDRKTNRIYLYLSIIVYNEI